MTQQPLRAGDIVRLKSPGYGEPDGPCVVVADQKGALVWFSANQPTSRYTGPCYVARRAELTLIRRKSQGSDGHD